MKSDELPRDASARDPLGRNMMTGSGYRSLTAKPMELGQSEGFASRSTAPCASA